MLAEAVPAEAAPAGEIQHLPTRAQIERFEGYLLELPQREIPLEHWLVGGLYFRQITIPADTWATGDVHRADHVSVMVSGDMVALTDRGMERVSGYHAWQGRAGHKRVGYAYADTVWLTVHRTDAQTVEQAEDALFENAPMLLSRREPAALEAAA